MTYRNSRRSGWRRSEARWSGSLWTGGVFKLAEIMGFPQAGQRMMQQSCPGFYLSVVEPGTLQAGQVFELEAGQRGLSVVDAFHAKRLKHLR